MTLFVTSSLVTSSAASRALRGSRAAMSATSWRATGTDDGSGDSSALATLNTLLAPAHEKSDRPICPVLGAAGCLIASLLLLPLLLVGRIDRAGIGGGPLRRHVQRRG